MTRDILSVSRFGGRFGLCQERLTGCFVCDCLVVSKLMTESFKASRFVFRTADNCVVFHRLLVPVCVS